MLENYTLFAVFTLAVGICCSEGAGYTFGEGSCGTYLDRATEVPVDGL